MESQLVYARMSTEEFKKQIGALRDHASTSDPITALPIHSLPSNEVFIWAITDKNPPMNFGIAHTKTDLHEIAKQHGIKGVADQYYRDQFEEIIRLDYPLISHMKCQNGGYSVAVWGNHLQCLCNLEPILLLENIDDQELLNVKRAYAQETWIGAAGGFIRNYIRQREAKRKLNRASKTNSVENPTFIEFLYSPENTWFIPRKRWVWCRHRVVKKTAKTIFVEESPYQDGPCLAKGWQAFIVYTVMIDRVELETNQCFHHHSRRKTFYTKAGAPELKNKKFPIQNRELEFASWFDGSEYVDTDDVIEIPDNDLQWAMAVFNINKWPVPHDEVRRSYKAIAQKLHPDKTGGDHKPMAAVNVALSILLGARKSR